MIATVELSDQIIKNLKRHSCAIVYGAKYTGKTYLVKYAVGKQLHKKPYEINCRDKPDINRNKLQNKSYSEDEVIVFKNAEASSEIDDAIIDLMVDKSIETIMLYNGTKEKIDAQFSKTLLEDRVDDASISMPPLNERKNEMFPIFKSFVEDTRENVRTKDGNRINIPDEIKKTMGEQFIMNIDDFNTLKKLVENSFLLAALNDQEEIIKDNIKEALETHTNTNRNNHSNEAIYKTALHTSWKRINLVFIGSTILASLIAFLYWYDFEKAMNTNITFAWVSFIKCIVLSALPIMFAVMSSSIVKKWIYGKKYYRKIKDIFEN